MGAWQMQGWLWRGSSCRAIRPSTQHQVHKDTRARRERTNAQARQRAQHMWRAALSQHGAGAKRQNWNTCALLKLIVSAARCVQR